MSASVEDMKKFIEPKSVALFGVSRRTGEGAFNILEQLLTQGYQGAIYPVNPNATEILGVRTFPSIRHVNHNGVDLAVINLPRNLVPGILGECAEAGIRHVVICTQGFADANDEEGRQLQKQIDGFISRGVRILGPNSLGTANPSLKFTSSFMPLVMSRIPIGVICQSGVFFGFPELRLLGKAFDIANSCDISFSDCLEYYEQDPETKVIVLHIEGMKESKRFIDTVSRVARKKPVLALKAARSHQAAVAAASHTGSLVGSDGVWDAALKQAGVVRLDGFGEVSDVANTFALMPLMKGRRVAIITGSGGFGVISVDACCRNGLEVAHLSPETYSRMQALYPPWQTVGNPLDYLPSFLVMKQPYRKVVTESLRTAMNDGQADAVLLMTGVTTIKSYHRLCEMVEEAVPGKPPKPLGCCLFGGYRVDAKQSLEAAGKAIVYDNPESAARALAYLARYSEFRRGFQDNPGIDG